MPRLLTPEKLAYWYFRLNGFMTMESFILHDESRKGLPQRTDADIYGVRFPFRSELNVVDDPIFRREDKKPFFIIGEIKTGECKLNGPWTDPAKQNMQYVLRAMGGFQPSVIEDIAKNLYGHYGYEDEERKIKLLAIGSRVNQDYDLGLDRGIVIMYVPTVDNSTRWRRPSSKR